MRWFVLACLLVLPVSAKRQKADPRDKALAELSGEVSEAIVAAAQGRPVDPRWSWGTGDFGVDTTDQQVEDRLAELGGDPEIVMTVVELEGSSASAEAPGYLRGAAVVMADGAVRWLAPSIRGKAPMLGHTAGLDEAAPALAGAVERLGEALADPACPLPLLERSEVDHIPAVLADALTISPAQLAQACETAAAKPFRWKPKVDDVTVLVRVGAKHVALRSGFVVDGERLLLDEVVVRAVE